MVSCYTRLKHWPVVPTAWPLWDEKKRTKAASVAKITPISTSRRPVARQHSSDARPAGRASVDEREQILIPTPGFSKNLNFHADASCIARVTTAIMEVRCSVSLPGQEAPDLHALMRRVKAAYSPVHGSRQCVELVFIQAFQQGWDRGASLQVVFNLFYKRKQ